MDRSSSTAGAARVHRAPQVQQRVASGKRAARGHWYTVLLGGALLGARGNCRPQEFIATAGASEASLRPSGARSYFLESQWPRFARHWLPSAAPSVRVDAGSNRVGAR